MAKITILTDTAFKKSTKDSTKLERGKDYVRLHKGESFEIKTIRREKNHYRVRLVEEIKPIGNSGYFFADHVNTDWQKICGVWLTNVDSDVLFSEEALITALDELKRLGFNTIYPTVWNKGYTLYPSQITTPIDGSLLFDKTQTFNYPSFTDSFNQPDMLKAIVELGHARGFRVIPWFEYGLAVPWKSSRPKWLTDNLAETWLTETRGGTKYIKSNEDGWAWLNPLCKDVENFFINLITDVVRRYDVDGIQLDDHFCLPIKLGYDTTTKNFYKRDTGADVPDEDSNEEWKKWRADKITNLLKRIFEEVKKVRPDNPNNRKCCISLSPGNTDADYTYNNNLVKWDDWEQMGFIEELVPQAYTENNELSNFIRKIKKNTVVRANNNIPTAIGIKSGTKKDYDKKKRPISISFIESKIKHINDNGYAGVSFFFYESLWENFIPPRETTDGRKNKIKKILGVFREL
jgi:uncharacterized lipoprotein YddW (UPF0748 family)